MRGEEKKGGEDRNRRGRRKKFSEMQNRGRMEGERGRVGGVRGKQQRKVGGGQVTQYFY